MNISDEDKMEEEDLFIKTSLGQFCGRYGFNCMQIIYNQLNLCV